MNISRILYKIVLNFSSIVMRRDYREYTGEVWNQCEIVHGSYEIFIIAYKNTSTINYPVYNINKPR